jgi:predicted DNA-binding transcriptional regulator YafY
VERKRLAADRFQRIWQLVESIARQPGRSRRELADAFSLSERQLQADLDVIRSEMHLPLVRRQGYRFDNEEGGPAAGLELQEAQLQLLLLRRAREERTAPTEQLERLVEKLPTLFPPHLQPLVGEMVQGGAAHGRRQEVFETLTRAILTGTEVRLQSPRGSPPASIAEAVEPELLLPYLESWYLIGTGKRRQRLVMVELDAVEAVNPTR